MLYWQFHFENEIPVNCLSTQWKWTYILDFGLWRWSALNMGFVDKWPSRMQGQWFVWSRADGRIQKKLSFLDGWLPLPESTSPEEFLGRSLTSPADQCLGSFWASIVGQDPCDSKSNRLHVDTFQFCFHSFEVYSIDSSEMIGNSSEVLNFNQLSHSNSTGSPRGLKPTASHRWTVELENNRFKAETSGHLPFSLRGVYRIFHYFIKKTREMLTCTVGY